jgi:hypothetical protein
MDKTGAGRQEKTTTQSFQLSKVWVMIYACAAAIRSLVEKFLMDTVG